MTTPRVSVVMPVRDEQRYVESAVRSILEQSFGDLELIVVDDGSTDETPGIVTRLAESDGRIRILRTESLGVVGALNAGVAAARGELVARMDGDDVSLPHRLDLQVAELDRRPGLGVLGTRVRYIDEEGAPISTWDVPVGARLVRWTLAFNTPIAHPSAVIRRSVLSDHPYRADAPHAEDYDLWVRLARVVELDNLSDVLLERRVHGASVSDRHAEVQDRTTAAVQRRAIQLISGVDPGDDVVHALREPASPTEVLRATRWIVRLYRAAGGGPELRRDALHRLAQTARLGLG